MITIYHRPQSRLTGNRGQSSMEYLMTYGWAVLVIAIIVSLLFALGVFNGLFGTPNVCAPQPGFTCTNPFYGTNGISATISQTSGQFYPGVWVFVVSSSEKIGGSGLPENFSTSSTNNMIYLGELGPSQTVSIKFTNTTAGDIPTANIPVGYPFSGYIWLGYCTVPGCTSPTSYSKVGEMSAAQAGTTFTEASMVGSTTTTGASTTTTVQSASYYLTEVSNPLGDGTASPGTGLYTSGSNVIIQETPANGYTFTGWTCIGTGCYSGSATNSVITITSNVVEIANFGQPYYLTLDANTSSDGSLSLSSGNYPSGEVLTIYATPSSSSYAFASWSCIGVTCVSSTNSVTITMPSSSAYVTANFGPACQDNWVGGTCIGPITYNTNTQLVNDVNTSGNITIESGVTLTTNQHNIWIAGRFINDGVVYTGGTASNGGAAVCTSGSSGETLSGNAGTNMNSQDPAGSGGAGGGNTGGGGAGGSTAASGGTPGAGGGNGNGGAGSTPSLSSVTLNNNVIKTWYSGGFQNYLEGAGGGGGNAVTNGLNNACSGGGGGGAYGLYIQAYSISAGNINAYGAAGGGGSDSGNNACGQGGGGGGGGAILIAYGAGGYTTGSGSDLAGGSGGSNGPCGWGSGGNGGSGQFVPFQYGSTPPLAPK